MTFKNLRTKLLKQRRFRQLLVSSIVLSIVIGLVVVPMEQSVPGATIKNTSDGLWWAIQTLTTVGYGDVTPVTNSGRIAGVLLQLIGTIMFGSLLAIISTSMSRAQEEFYWNRLFERLGELEKEVIDLKKDARYLVKERTSVIQDEPLPDQ